ncbi:hypothetical protein Poli38472_014025 [Pythium oligandrum]|uniref:Uncharacterized protein n=1 Tax=Pythium oligandrum TaxID=41045 RepID=A0A8K1CQW3_PYTOL|nr:hypothetical protein Poli38472_014025 [Pythium oligandrum]|eukprot:TMW66713.1 hypothetical protein Poli38472_014025 [Pythium oligandrum]
MDMAVIDEQHTQQEAKRRPPSYRILGSFPHVEDVDANNGESEEEDPMAWADLEEYGGSKQTLEKKKKTTTRKLTHAEVRAQLQELKELELKMAEATADKHSKRGMFETIEWLKKHNQEAKASSDKQKRRHSNSVVRSVLDFFHRSPKNEQNNSNEDNAPQLQSPWGQAALKCEWPELGFTLLNQALVDDTERVRQVMESEELWSASPHAIIALAKWLRRFDEDVNRVLTLKQYLLEERTVLANVGYQVTTLYDSYKEALNAALALIHGDRHELQSAILQTFEELEAILSDEVAVVKDVVEQSMDEAQEYTALSNLFQHLTDDDCCGVIVPKLLGWMKQNCDEEEVQAFLALFDDDVKDAIAGEWMRHYASYLQLLDEFSANFESPLAYLT